MSITGGKFRDRNCKSGYMREEDLIEQLAELMNEVNLDEMGMKEKIVSTYIA